MLVTQLGHAYLVLEPSTHDLIRYLKRTTQIIFSKDAAYLVQRLNLFPGRRVIEAGTGSGGFTLALARAVMPTGRVISYEERAPMSELAAKNLARFSLLDYVDLKVRNIADGFDERNADAARHAGAVAPYWPGARGAQGRRLLWRGRCPPRTRSANYCARNWRLTALPTWRSKNSWCDPTNPTPSACGWLIA